MYIAAHTGSHYIAHALISDGAGHITTKSEGLALLLCGYLSFISEMLAIVRDC